MIHPYQPGSLKGRILRALQTGPAYDGLLPYLSSSVDNGAYRTALRELTRDGYVRRDDMTWRLASQPPVRS